MKKLLTLILTVVLAVGCISGLVACGDDKYNEVEIPEVASESFTQFDSTQINADFKLGVICLHDENSTYDKNFIDAVKAAQQAFGLSDEQVIIYTGIPEGDNCKTKAIELADMGCKAVFADSFGHEEFLIAAAKERPNVQFFHATGTQAKQVKLANFHDAFASIYEGRYLAGYAAGLKLQEMIDNNKITDKNKDANGNIKLGYVGAWTYAEVISGFTSWYLGVKSVVPNVVMDVQFTGSWYDEAGEKSAAETLISRGAAIVSQHADSWGAPNACENAGVPNVSYNGSTISACPDTFIVSSKIDWTYYFKWIIASVGGNAKAVDADFTGTLSEGAMVKLSKANGDVIAKDTVDKIVAVRNQLLDGSLKVFDCSKFTVGGKALTEYLADIDGDYTGETNVIKTVGSITYFDESNATDFRSAPYFDIQIDGITYLNAVYGTKEDGTPDFIDLTK